jgi:hypothetical protein
MKILSKIEQLEKIDDESMEEMFADEDNKQKSLKMISNKKISIFNSILKEYSLI